MICRKNVNALTAQEKLDEFSKAQEDRERALG